MSTALCGSGTRSNCGQKTLVICNGGQSSIKARPRTTELPSTTLLRPSHITLHFFPMDSENAPLLPVPDLESNPAPAQEHLCTRCVREVDAAGDKTTLEITLRLVSMSGMIPHWFCDCDSTVQINNSGMPTLYYDLRSSRGAFHCWT